LSDDKPDLQLHQAEDEATGEAPQEPEEQGFQPDGTPAEPPTDKQQADQWVADISLVAACLGLNAMTGAQMTDQKMKELGAAVGRLADFVGLRMAERKIITPYEAQAAARNGQHN